LWPPGRGPRCPSVRLSRSSGSIRYAAEHAQGQLAAGFFVGVVPRSVLLGVLLFALGAIFFAVRGYLNTGDRRWPGL
jgi:hypothetical protein